MKCTECGNAMTKSIGDHVYLESGMDHVILRNTTKYICESCGAQRIQIVAMAKLHHLLAYVLATKPARLLPSEVRFLRDHLELANKEFATLMGVSETQASRWTSSEPIGVPAERFLRMMALLGPIALASRDAPTVQIGKMIDGQFVPAELVGALGKFPSKDEPVRTVPIQVRRSNTDWQHEVTAAA